MLPWFRALPQRRPTWFLVSLGRRGQTGVLGRGQGLTLHLLSEAVDIIGLIGVADAIGSHAWKLILVPIAAFPWSVDGVPARNPEWMLCDTQGTEGVRGLGPGILLPCGRKRGLTGVFASLCPGYEDCSSLWLCSPSFDEIHVFTVSGDYRQRPLPNTYWNRTSRACKPFLCKGQRVNILGLWPAESHLDPSTLAR